MKNPDTKRTLMCKVLKPLASSGRLVTFALLDNENRSIEQLSKRGKMCESTVSRHLRVLYKSGLIKRNKRGQQVFYRLDHFVIPLADELGKMTNCILTKQLGSS